MENGVKDVYDCNYKLILILKVVYIDICKFGCITQILHKVFVSKAEKINTLFKNTQSHTEYSLNQQSFILQSMQLFEILHPFLISMQVCRVISR